MNLAQKLKTLNACDDALEWVNGSNPESLWSECERGDWMLWLVGKLDIDRKRLVLAACQCARLVWHLMEDERSKEAIEVAEAWTRGEATEGELRRATAAAYAYATEAATTAAEAATAAAYAYATEAATTAATAATTAATAAEAAEAAYAATAAAYAATAAAYAAAVVSRRDMLKKCADITRQYFTFTETLEALDDRLSNIR